MSDALAALRAKHTAAAASAQRALAGAKLSDAERQDADDLLTALAGLLAGDGAVHQQLAYLLEGAIGGIRLRRQADAPAAA